MSTSSPSSSTAVSSDVTRTRSTAESLQGSLRNSAIARLLIEGRPLVDKSINSGAPSSASAAASSAARMYSSPPPIDLSTANRTKDLAEEHSSYSLSTITTIERLRCILSFEMRSLLSRVNASASVAEAGNGSIVYTCRLCPFAVSQVIELVAHYRYHSDTLANLGYKSPEVLTGWFDYYAKTSALRPVSSNSVILTDQSGDATSPASINSTLVGSRLDLRSLLLKPFKASSVHPRSDERSSAASRHRASSESHLLRPVACRTVDGQSRSSTPYTMISGLTDDDNNQNHHPVYAKRALSVGRQILDGPFHATDFSIKFENDDAAASPVRSPLSNYSERSAKDRSVNSSQDGGAQSPAEMVSDYLGQFQNGGNHTSGRAVVDRSPPTLRCELRRCSDQDIKGLRINSFLDGDDFKYANDFRDGEDQKEVLAVKSSNKIRLLHPGIRLSDEIPNQCCNRSKSEGSGVENKYPTKPTNHEDGNGDDQSAARSSKSPHCGETVEQEYAYKQYKRLRKSNTPKSVRQEAAANDAPPCESTPNYVQPPCSTASEYTEMPRVSGVGQHNPTPEVGNFKGNTQSFDVGIQCDLIFNRFLPRTCDVIAENACEDVEKYQTEGRYRRKRVFNDDDDCDVMPNICVPASCYADAMPNICATPPGESESSATPRCSPCGITFDDDVIFSIHMGCHSHAHPFVCNICGRPCENKYAFNTHILRGHHPT